MNACACIWTFLVMVQAKLEQFRNTLYIYSSVSKANMAFVYNKIKTYLSSFQFCNPFKHVNEMINMRGQVSYNSSIPCLLKVKSKFH